MESQVGLADMESLLAKTHALNLLKFPNPCSEEPPHALILDECAPDSKRVVNAKDLIKFPESNLEANSPRSSLSRCLHRFAHPSHEGLVEAKPASASAGLQVAKPAALRGKKGSISLTKHVQISCELVTEIDKAQARSAVCPQQDDSLVKCRSANRIVEVSAAETCEESDEEGLCTHRVPVHAEKPLMQLTLDQGALNRELGLFKDLEVTDEPSDFDYVRREHPLESSGRTAGIYDAQPRHGYYRRGDGTWSNPRDFEGLPDPWLEAAYRRYHRGDFIEGFLPIPGDIMLTDRIREAFFESYLGPNPGGNCTVFVDRGYFERDQDAIEDIEYQMQRFFTRNDMIVRFGKFEEGWIWTPQSHVEIFVFRGPSRRIRSNQELAVPQQLSCNLFDKHRNICRLLPPDPLDRNTMIHNRVQPPPPAPSSLNPREADLLIRHEEDETVLFADGNPEDWEFFDGDLLLRVSIQKTIDPYRIFTVDLYMYQILRQPDGVRPLIEVNAAAHVPVIGQWIFRGRDVQMFGPPDLDENGNDRVLDRNGPQPFDRRAIPHWEAHEREHIPGQPLSSGDDDNDNDDDDSGAWYRNQPNPRTPSAGLRDSASVNRNHSRSNSGRSGEFGRSSEGSNSRGFGGHTEEEEQQQQDEVNRSPTPDESSRFSRISGAEGGLDAGPFPGRRRRSPGARYSSSGSN